MTVHTIAQQLLTHFPPEQRSIPDSASYPGCNASVLQAMNGALQEMFTGSAPWVRKDERGALLHAPSVSVAIDVTYGSTLSTISAGTWQDWFSGCSIVIAGGSITNQIRNNSRQVILKFPYDGVTELRMVVSGATTSGVSGVLIYCGKYNGKDSWSSDGLAIGDPGPGTPTTILWAAGDWYVTQCDRYAGPPSYHSTVESTADSPAGLTFGNPTTGAGIPVVTPSLANTKSATVYQTSLEVASDMMDVLGPVKANGIEIGPVGCAPTRINPNDGLGVICGNPTCYSVDSWSPDATTAPATRISLYPAPDANGFLEYKGKIAPPVITSLLSTVALPIPLQFVESIFLPLALQRLQSCPFFVDNGHADEVARAYKQAKIDLINLSPRTNSGTRLRSLY